MIFRKFLQFLYASLRQITIVLEKTVRGNLYGLNEMVLQINPGSNVKLLEQKYVCFYDYVDLHVRLDLLALYTEVDFVNNLGGVECIEANYAYAQHVLPNFKGKTLKNYFKVYLLSNNCLFADVFLMFQVKLFE